jgi:hypothetical protein
LKDDAKSRISVDEVLAQWGKGRAQAIAGYRRFVLDGITDGHRYDLYQVVMAWLGGELGGLTGQELAKDTKIQRC